jgi:hypothetical protein
LAVVGVEDVDRRVRRRVPLEDALRHRALPLAHIFPLFDLELEKPVAVVGQDEDSGGVVNRPVESVSGRGQDAPGRSDLEAVDASLSAPLVVRQRPELGGGDQGMSATLPTTLRAIRSASATPT